MSVVVAGEVVVVGRTVSPIVPPVTAITSAEQPLCMYEWLMALKQCCHTASLDPPVREGGVTAKGRRRVQGCGVRGEEGGWMGRAVHSPPLGLGTESVARGRVPECRKRDCWRVCR